MRTIVLVVPREAAGARLDRFLASTLSAMEDGPSRSELQRWIDHGGVKVDGVVTNKPAEKLREGARLEVQPEPPPSTEALAEDGIEFDVVYMDDAVLVLNKPAGLVVHPARGHRSGTLVNGLLARGVFDPPDGDEEIDERPSVSVRKPSTPAAARPSRPPLVPSPPTSTARVSARAAKATDAKPAVAPKAKKKAPKAEERAPKPEENAPKPAPELGIPPSGPPDLDRARPGIVHRLDKGTSGLMVVARHPRAREHLKAQFAEHSIEREYVAIVLGDVRAPQTFDTLHGRDPRDRLKFSSKVKTGKRAVTHVRPLESLVHGLATYVACRLETGRTHQIRVHLADHRTPILGDALYGKPPKHDVLREAAEALGHPALHARVLGFVHPVTGERMRFEVDPPADFEVALTALRAIP